MENYDFIIVGAGIVGLTVARSLALRRYGSVLILEKEPSLGRHASGRNSGVLHTGIYYPAHSLKAKVCAEGARLLRDYATERGISMRKTGKVILPTKSGSAPMLEVLFQQAKANGARVEMVDTSRLREIEPEAKLSDRALFVQDAAVIDAHAVLAALEKEIESSGVTLKKNSAVRDIDPQKQIVKTKTDAWRYGHLVNAAGLYADKIAHRMDVGRQYRILPFKGIYRKLSAEASKRIQGLIYPVPNLKMPFLGVHFTKTVAGDVLVGPTATPAFGRENYGLFEGLDLKDSFLILRNLCRMLKRNKDGMRNLVKEESLKYWPPIFLKEAQELVPTLQERDFLKGQAMVGIRAQLFDQSKMQLVMDFVVERGKHSVHILNAISPAFTASLAFAELVVDGLKSN